MGALLSFELVRHLRRTYNLFPVCLFVSGRGAPQLPEPHRPIHALPDTEFVKEIRRLNGTPEKVLVQAELMQLLLPVLRADFALCETYTYSREAPFDCPISAFGGLTDPIVSRERLQAWRYQTRAAFSLTMLPGDHFFLHTASSLLLQTLSRECHQVISKEKQRW
jgi:medium-chain acyl-[acyl-carrier-protein] hydrolase